MFGYLRPWGELVNDAIVAVGETLLKRNDRRAAQHRLLGRFESDGPDAACMLADYEAEREAYPGETEDLAAIGRFILRDALRPAAAEGIVAPSPDVAAAEAPAVEHSPAPAGAPGLHLVESGYDMGCRWAAEMFPQHTRNNK